MEIHMTSLKRGSAFAAALAAVFIAVGHAQAKPVAYPAKGQSAQQQQKDDGECYAWAKNKTGIDPAAVAAAPPPSGPAVGGGERARGAVRGAAVGGIVDGGDGARTGAAVGVVAGGARARQNQKGQQQAAQAGSIDTYNRAYAACMEGRGYSIK
jgi:hypothetical protein